MKKFSFRLETLLRHRKNLEEKERIELSRLFFMYQTHCNQLKSLQDKHHDTLIELAQKKTVGADHQELTWFYLYLDRLRLEIKQSEQRLEQTEKELELQKLKVIEATKNKKVLDALKAKKAREHRIEGDRQEQKSIDDLVITRYANREK